MPVEMARTRRDDTSLRENTLPLYGCAKLIHKKFYRVCLLQTTSVFAWNGIWRIMVAAERTRSSMVPVEGPKILKKCKP